MSSLNDLKINLNGQYTFFLNQDVISEYSGSLRKTIKQSKRKRNKKKKSPEIITIEIDDFPGGPDGFELVSRFCYNNGEISIDVSNVSTLYCCSVYLGMTEKFCFSNLFLQTEKFLEEVFYGSWNDIISCLKNCEQVFPYADSYGLVDKLIFAALTKISRTSDEFSSSSLSSFASSQSPEMTKNTPESDKRYLSCGRSNEWWFEDMSSLSPQIILKLIMIIGAYKTNIKNLVLTGFLLHYFKTTLQTKSRTSTELMRNKLEYSDLADTAVKGVVFAGKTAFSCRKLLWVLRVLSSFSLSRESRISLETLIGEMLEQAKLDDLLISSGGSRESGFYNVDLVIRLLKVFVMNREEESREENMKEMGNLIDKYLREISPDQNLKVSKFLGVAESLPDSARDCYDGVYRAIDIYLQSHPNLTSQDRTKICRCLNYKKLTMETCKQLARNPKIPPEIAIEALKSRCEGQAHTISHVKVTNKSFSCRYSEETKKPVLLHLEISEKLSDRLKTIGGYSGRVMDSFREGL